MVRLFSLLLAVSLGLAACAPAVPVSSDGQIKAYRINPRDTAKIQFRLLDNVNSLRAARGVAPLELNSALNAAAATHSRDMSVQNRPWHFGSDGSSPLDRVRRAGYPGLLKGENISETFETELATLAAWMAEPSTRDVVLDAGARDLGFSWHQESNGKIWWTLITGGPGVTPVAPISAAPSAGFGAPRSTPAADDGVTSG